MEEPHQIERQYSHLEKSGPPSALNTASGGSQRICPMLGRSNP